MQIPEELIEQIKEQNNIVDIISEDIHLKKTGKNYFGLCPFHNDKSPSLSVSEDKQIYKCFSCGEAGNVITFIMKYKKMSFIEALKYLADKVGISFDLGYKEDKELINKKNTILKINVESARFYFRNLQKFKKAKDYFLNRGIREETIRRFGLGYAPMSFNALLNYLRRKGYKNDILIESGVISNNPEKKTIYDRFRDRVIFPVFNVKGQVIGFGGRVFDNSKPKYLNSPETIVFDKGVNLYGLNFSIKNGLKDDYIIIVEGYMDLISLHQAGITNSVASLGTALTENQSKLLKRYVSKVIISYDADAAGQKATLRGLEILRNSGFDVRVLKVPEGKDPDEFVRKNGRDAFLKLAKNAVSLIEYRINKASYDLNLKNDRDLIKYGERITEILADLNPVEKDVYVKKISEKTSIKEQALYDLLSQVMKKKLKSNNSMNKEEYYGTKLYIEPAYIKAERGIIKLILDHKIDTESVIRKIYGNTLISNIHQKIFELAKKALKSEEDDVYKYIENRCTDIETSKEWVKIKDTYYKEQDFERLLSDFLKEINNYKIKSKADSLIKKQKELQREGKIDDLIEITRELVELRRKL
ncbi:DNA primase [Clostridium sp. BJN0001]|uniref:DNA primase n=1 Tax=Clostridium sp. BJN0001 TaxID=2930219 RepID=UPI001FD2ED4E|nr:DNA primase [Clostridium sp. BJN0001]